MPRTLYSKPRTSAAREWLYLAVALGLAYGSIPFTRAPTQWAKMHHILLPLVAFTFVAAGTGVGWALAQGVARIRDARTWTLLGILALVYLWLLAREPYPEEALHLLEYGLIAFLTWRVLGYYLDGLRRELVAIVLTSGFGWIDELIQGITPKRQYDPKDVILNVIAAVLAIVCIVVVQGARRADV